MNWYLVNNGYTIVFWSIVAGVMFGIIHEITSCTFWLQKSETEKEGLRRREGFSFWNSDLAISLYFAVTLCGIPSLWIYAEGMPRLTGIIGILTKWWCVLGCCWLGLWFGLVLAIGLIRGVWSGIKSSA